MRKKSKYKPKGVRLDAVNWVLAGLKPISSVGDAVVVLKQRITQHLQKLCKAEGTVSR